MSRQRHRWTAAWTTSRHLTPARFQARAGAAG